MSEPVAPTEVMPTPGKWRRLLDWKLILSTTLLGVIAVISCDQLNYRADAYFAPKEQLGPDVRTWTVDSVHTIDVTLVTADETRLACADDRTFGDAHCEYTKAKALVPAPPGAPLDNNRQPLIQPYRTANGNHLLFIAGLWNTPALALRSHQEPAATRTDKELRRFVARCRLKFVGAMNNVEVRWSPDAKWYTEAYAPVALAEWCEIPRGEQ